MPVVVSGSPALEFTEITVTGSFVTQAGRPAAGTVTFTLTQAMSNGDVTVPADPITVNLDSEGQFSTILLANDDPGTTPQGVQYGVTEQVTGAQPRDYFILVSRSTNPVSLSSLMPGEAGWA
jgi:hypothetical protein